LTGVSHQYLWRSDAIAFYDYVGSSGGSVGYYFVDGNCFWDFASKESFQNEAD
jgi:hypothetical protein